MRDWRGKLGIVVGTPGVVECWWRLLAPLPPWDGMPADDAHGMMRRVVAELLDDEEDLELRDRCIRIMLAAREHGVFRRAQQSQRRNLVYEIDALEDGLLNALRTAGMSASLRHDILHALSLEFRLIREASLRGWDQR